MAVINDYVNTLIAAGKRDKAAFCGGAQFEEIIVAFSVLATDNNASIYRLVKDISPNMILTSAMIANDTGLTSGTGYDLGLYATVADGGAVIIDNVYGTGLDLSSQHLPSAPLNALNNLATLAWAKMIFENAGHTILTKFRGYDICLTADTASTAAGAICVKMGFLQG